MRSPYGNQGWTIFPALLILPFLLLLTTLYFVGQGIKGVIPTF